MPEKASSDSALLQRGSAADRAHHAEAAVAALFRGGGWKVVRQPSVPSGARPDLLVSRPGLSYIVEIKTAAEGRSDRLLPLWAQALLEAARSAGGKHVPLAIAAAPRIAPSVADQILKFAAEYAPQAAAGVIDFEGLRRFQGPHLESLNAPPPRPAPTISKRPGGLTLFSDLNQWMLKVLLAPELPDSLLTAPRGRYRNASQLARAADVSVMSAFRFVRQLQLEGYLHESDPYLSLVRREHLFSRWQASSLGRMEQEIPMRFLLRGDIPSQLRPILKSGRACLALFAAADALGFGFVSGVPAYVYVQRLTPPNIAAWKNLVPTKPGESPDLIMRRAHAARSIFRGIVRPNGMLSCDVLQVWLDASGHPARGQEQADLIRRRVLEPLISGRRAHG
jgi:hypothetical protein